MHLKPAFLLVFLVLGVGIGRSDDAPKELDSKMPANVAPISVVHTWGDLLTQEPVTLQKKVSRAEKPDKAPSQQKPLTFRLGIDSTHAKRDGFVVVYCLAQGDLRLIERMQLPRAPSLGPFSIRVQGPLKEEHIEDFTQAKYAYPYMISHPAALFLKAIPLPEPGSYTFSVQEPEVHFRTVASVNVIASADRDLGWSPWTKAKYHDDRTSDAGTCWMDVTNTYGGIALPSWDGSQPKFLDKLPESTSPLPKFIPLEPDASLQLSKNGNDFIVKTDGKQGLTDFFPDNDFLTRWWINGKPFLPKSEIPATLQQGQAWEGHVSALKEMHFIVDFHPEYLGVKKGDTVGVQLLFCPEGWEYIGLAQDQKYHALDESFEPLPLFIARPTNRIEFVYSGDPAHL